MAKSIQDSRQYKLLLAGDGGVGKTTYLNRLSTGRFERCYNATLGVELTPLEFNTNIGLVTFNCWDVAGQEKFGGYHESYFAEVDAAIIMFDITSKISYNNIIHWYRLISNNCVYIPIVLFVNKVDVKDRKVKPKDINFHRTRDLYYYDISARSNYNIEKPLLKLLKQLTNNDNCRL